MLVSRGANLPRYGDAFLLKLGRGGRTKWVRQIGGTGSDGGDEVAIGPHRNIYVIGDANGPVTFTPSVTLPPTGGRDAWAARYRPDGSLVWARSLGGTGRAAGHGISPDPDGKTLVTGEFQGTAQFGSHRLDSAGARPDVFIAKLDRQGRVRWAQRFGDGDREIGRGIDADSRGNIYFSGEFQGTIQLGATTLTSAGGDDSFLAKPRPRRRRPLGDRLRRPGRRDRPGAGGRRRRQQLPQRHVLAHRAHRRPFTLTTTGRARRLRGQGLADRSRRVGGADPRQRVLDPRGALARGRTS